MSCGLVGDDAFGETAMVGDEAFGVAALGAGWLPSGSKYSLRQVSTEFGSDSDGGVACCWY